MGVTEVGSHTGNPYDFMAEKESISNGDLAAAFSELVQEQREEFIAKLRTGTTEPSYQIGAGSYTQKQWDRLLKGFDAAEDALRKAAGLEEKRKTTEEKRKSEDNAPAAPDINMLLVESTSCTYPSSDPEEGDVRYITFYSPDGIFCRKEGQTSYEWKIDFEDASQYEKVMDFLEGLDTQDDLRFACQEDFWRAFLQDQFAYGRIL